MLIKLTTAVAEQMSGTEGSFLLGDAASSHSVPDRTDYLINSDNTGVFYKSQPDQQLSRTRRSWFHSSVLLYLEFSVSYSELWYESSTDRLTLHRGKTACLTSIIMKYNRLNAYLIFCSPDHNRGCQSIWNMDSSHTFLACRVLTHFHDQTSVEINVNVELWWFFR